MDTRAATRFAGGRDELTGAAGPGAMTRVPSDPSRIATTGVSFRVRLAPVYEESPAEQTLSGIPLLPGHGAAVGPGSAALGKAGVATGTGTAAPRPPRRRVVLPNQASAASSDAAAELLRAARGVPVAAGAPAVPGGAPPVPWPEAVPGGPPVPVPWPEVGPNADPETTQTLPSPDPLRSPSPGPLRSAGAAPPAGALPAGARVLSRRGGGPAARPAVPVGLSSGADATRAMPAFPAPSGPEGPRTAVMPPVRIAPPGGAHRADGGPAGRGGRAADAPTGPLRRLTGVHAWYPGRRMNLGLVLLPLRIVLGVMLLGAGVAKLTDPVYFDGGARGSMMRWLESLHPWQLAAPAVDVAVAHPVGAGLTVAFVQIAVGAMSILGLWQRVCAAVGMLLAVVLLVTVSWRSGPVYDTPDVLYLAAWSPLLIAGAPLFSLDSRLAGEAWRRFQPRPDVWQLRRRVIVRSTPMVALVLGLTLLLGAGLGASTRARQDGPSGSDTGLPDQQPAPSAPGTPGSGPGAGPRGDASASPGTRSASPSPHRSGGPSDRRSPGAGRGGAGAPSSDGAPGRSSGTAGSGPGSSTTQQSGPGTAGTGGGTETGTQPGSSGPSGGGSGPSGSGSGSGSPAVQPERTGGGAPAQQHGDAGSKPSSGSGNGGDGGGALGGLLG